MIEPKKNLENITPYYTDMYPDSWDMKLDSNENYIGPSTKVVNAIRNIDVEDISRYPFYGVLYESVAKYYDIDISNIVLTNGADEAISAVLNTYVNAGDKVVTVSPSFSMPEIYSSIIGAQYVKVPYKNKWKYPFDDVISEIDENTKAVILTTPNNPTGDIVPEDEIISIIEKYPAKLIILDETYANFSGFTNVPLIKKYENVVIIKSMSKDFALAGLRLGYVISNSANISNIKKILSPYNVNNIAVIAGVAALNDTKYINYVKNEINNAKTFLKEELTKLGFVPYESFANFILVDFKDKSDWIYEKLKENKIAVKKFSNPELKNFIRITLPTLSGAKRLLGYIKSKDTLVFDMDGVLVDVSNSYMEAIKYTYNYFTGKTVSDEDIQNAKAIGGLNNDWDLTQYLIGLSGFKFPYEDIVKVFQKQYWDNGDGSINNEVLLIDKNLLEELSKNYNMAIFTGRPQREAFYTLDKFDIKKYFQKIITMDDLPSDRQKPHTLGLHLIKESFFTDKLVYMGDTVDDARCAGSFGAIGVGVLPPSNKTEELKELLIKCGDKAVVENINDIKNILENINHET